MPAKRSASPALAPEQTTALVLQGGGALGAYQAGVYEALAKADYRPCWVAGISIGAINAALIAGNARGDRLPALRAFWDKVSSNLTAPAPAADGFWRTWFNEAAAQISAATGVPGFFTPRLPPAPFAVPGTLEAISLYDTSPLRKTLLDLVDFDRINSGETRLSVGAVNVLTGNFAYFDNFEDGADGKRTIGPEHIMASGALPPGFPPVMIEGEPWWDGGLVSNTPLQYVLDWHRGGDCTVFQVDLFSARGAMPATLPEVAVREKDIRYSSRTRLNTDMARRLKTLGAAAQRLIERLPPELRDDPDARLLAGVDGCGAIEIVHLINRPEAYETQSKDYEFSRETVTGHWRSGLEDTELSLARPEWVKRPPRASGVVTYDLGGPVPMVTTG